MTYEFTPKGLAMQAEVKQFMTDHIYPNELALIREDDTAAPNFARPVALTTDNVVELQRRKSDTA